MSYLPARMESHVHPAPLESDGSTMLVLNSVFLPARHESYGNPLTWFVGAILQENKQFFNHGLPCLHSVARSCGISRPGGFHLNKVQADLLVFQQV